MSSPEPTFYRLDSDDRIVEVGGAWDTFAEENGGTGLSAQRIVGTSLFKYISGATSRTHIWTAVDSARKLLSVRRVPYRCDSPGLKRFMEMVIKPEGSGDVLVEHFTLRVEPMQHRAAFVAGSGHSLLIRCSMCNRIRIKGIWMEADTAVGENRLSPEATHCVAYGVCTDCRQRAGRAPRAKAET